MNTEMLLAILSIIPSEKVAGVQKALTNTFGNQSIQSITPLSGGLSTALVYQVVVEGRAYVLRLIMHIDPLSDPVRQYQCMRLAADAGIAPAVHYTSTEDAISIVDYIEPLRPMTAAFASADAFLIALAQAVKAIHATPLFPPLVNFMDGVDGFIAMFKASNTLPTSATAEHFELYAQIQEHYPRHDPDLVSSHNDLNYNNILFDGQRFWIIDWEAAFRNDRYVDLANIANGFASNEADESVLLRAYFGDDVDETKRARLFLMRQTCRFFYAMIMLNSIASHLPAGTMHDARMQTPSYDQFRQMIANGTTSLASYDGKLLYAKVILNEALASMKSPRFAQSIEVMKRIA